MELLHSFLSNNLIHVLVELHDNMLCAQFNRHISPTVGNEVFCYIIVQADTPNIIASRAFEMNIFLC